MKKKNNFMGYILSGVGLFYAGTYFSESLFFPALGRIIDNCPQGFLQRGTGFQCEYSPFIWTSVIGAIFVIVGLIAQRRHFGIPNKRIGLAALAFMVLSFGVNIFWREILAINQNLTEDSQLGYTYLVFWVRTVAGMMLGAIIAMTSRPKAKKATASTKNELKVILKKDRTIAKTGSAKKKTVAKSKVTKKPAKKKVAAKKTAKKKTKK